MEWMPGVRFCLHLSVSGPAPLIAVVGIEHDTSPSHCGRSGGCRACLLWVGDSSNGAGRNPRSELATSFSISRQLPQWLSQLARRSVSSCSRRVQITWRDLQSADDAMVYLSYFDGRPCICSYPSTAKTEIPTRRSTEWRPGGVPGNSRISGGPPPASSLARRRRM